MKNEIYSISSHMFYCTDDKYKVECKVKFPDGFDTGEGTKIKEVNSTTFIIEGEVGDIALKFARQAASVVARIENPDDATQRIQRTEELLIILKNQLNEKYK